MWIRVNTQKPFLGLMALLIAMTWLALAIWSFSPYAQYLNHQILEELHFTLSSDYMVLLLIFIAGWTLMTIAMMLPTSLPLITLFRHMTGARSDRSLLVTLLIAGYLSIWVLFGGLAHFGDLFVHELVEHTTWLQANTWSISAAVLAAAGLYQFSSLKYKCLDKCRSPLSFITQHWRGHHERARSFALGVHHGLFCLGCCWSLMLLMFAVACGNLAWMLGLGAIMAIEKNMPWGRQVSAPLGVVLLGCSIAVTLSGLFIL